MSTVLRTNRKAHDADIIVLNSVGLSLATIGKMLGCHPTTVTQRLKSLGVEPADTRRTFMEDIFRALDEDVQMFVAEQVQTQTIKDYVKQLIIDDFNKKVKP